MIKVVKPTFTSIIVEANEKQVLINVNDSVQFAVLDTGEVKNGTLNAISKVKGGKKDSPEYFTVSIAPDGATHTEVWDSRNMIDDSFTLDKEEEEE